jgi:hypothetical protein
MEMPHANARAAIAIAVTEVVGVLVMVGAFPEVWWRMVLVYAMPDAARNKRVGHWCGSAARLSHLRHAGPARPRC